eukprot:CAMPEP_0169191814 /NCGR_PEP_ID=MMETSP1016-20121227/5273_1 /TAXON_ID=342587 /ORGANISM="Karlodinium micrum, Strain CCMP2283" /LENGTH=55 /DNA_ID=CAMNT_0009268095 /DNA_START=1714 /DNA_END=1881 /DNA_ORIENTATION=-
MTGENELREVPALLTHVGALTTVVASLENLLRDRGTGYAATSLVRTLAGLATCSM